MLGCGRERLGGIGCGYCRSLMHRMSLSSHRFASWLELSAPKFPAYRQTPENYPVITGCETLLDPGNTAPLRARKCLRRWADAAIPIAFPLMPVPPLRTARETTPSPVWPHSVALSWVASVSVVLGYNVYRGASDGGPYMNRSHPLKPAWSYNTLRMCKT